MLEIKKGKNGFYIGENEENVLAEITFVNKDENTIIANHTYVTKSLRGQNIARQLLTKLVEYARSENKKIIPVCSYVVREFERNPDYDDLLSK